ncbi:complex I subunit 4 family protein [Capsulimonas corticalis]|uniref:complex I subunit 4 family protein n=1 Tax=Capsulimonas corticalis TaxID=2219043 RepID=UPI000FF971E5|nr:NADH-quinone oxidoreductase subunit M [Capsulimonas corticalis]
MNDIPWLSIVIFLPLVFAVVALTMKNNPSGARMVAFVGTIVTLVVSVLIYANFNSAQTYAAGAPHFQLLEKHSWIALSKGSVNYLLGVDGVSLLMVLMTTGIFPFIVGVSKDINERHNQYYFWVLLMETAVLGVFLSLNLVLFYIFWEAMLIPAYFIIGIWGGPKRIYATVKFFLYTMVGSMLMLVSILGVYFLTGATSFDLPDLQAALPAVLGGHLTTEMLLFGGFFLAFGIKAPIWPFHTWVPDAYAEAPTGGSIILVALKMGLYGFIRFCIPMFPNAVHALAPAIIVLAVIGVVYAALVASMQTDLKRLIAYSSVSHIGVILLAIFSMTGIGIAGAVIQMVSHTITTGALFILGGALYSRRQSYAIADYGGLMKVMPGFTVLFLIATLSSVALPLTSGFAGEILMLAGSFQTYPWATAVATTSAIWSVVYMLWMFQRVMYGPLDKPENQSLPDTTPGEKLALWPLVALIFIIGVFPTPILNKLNSSVSDILSSAGGAQTAAATPIPVAAPVNALSKMPAVASAALTHLKD